MLNALHPLLGIKLKLIDNAHLTQTKAFAKVVIGNHQNTYDLFTISKAVDSGTVSIGKKSIRWIPFFGQLYWLAGNILIDRNNKMSAKETINQITQKIVSNNLSVWMFPEGTRSRGKGLLPFKLGAFNTAIQAGVPIVPIVMSSTSSFSLNKLNNGYAIVQVLDPIPTENLTLKDAKSLAQQCHRLIEAKIAELDLQVSALNTSRLK